MLLVKRLYIAICETLRGRNLAPQSLPLEAKAATQADEKEKRKKKRFSIGHTYHCPQSCFERQLMLSVIIQYYYPLFPSSIAHYSPQRDRDNLIMVRRASIFFPNMYIID
jgi:hypothetical protein